MPQLDFTLLFNQVFWLFTILISFYIITVYSFLPTLLKIFQTRKQFFLKNKKEAQLVNKNVQNSLSFYKKKAVNFNQISYVINSITFSLNDFTKKKLKPYLIPVTVIYFISDKTLFNQVFKSNK